MTRTGFTFFIRFFGKRLSVIGTAAAALDGLLSGSQGQIRLSSRCYESLSSSHTAAKQMNPRLVTAASWTPWKKLKKETTVKKTFNGSLLQAFQQTSVDGGRVWVRNVDMTADLSITFALPTSAQRDSNLGVAPRLAGRSWKERKISD